MSKGNDDKLSKRKQCNLPVIIAFFDFKDKVIETLSMGAVPAIILIILQHDFQQDFDHKYELQATSL